MKERMPAMFFGHGNPMNAIEDNEFSQAWMQASVNLPVPRAIVCISAHWQTVGTEVTTSSKPITIHDFSGFPDEMYDLQYPAPGSPQLADEIFSVIKSTKVRTNQDRGLDHGAWSVLMRLFPGANIPVVQLSLDQTQGSQFHYELGSQLKQLREKDVLVIGSGNIVHNLNLMVWRDTAFEWAQEFDSQVKGWITTDEHQPIIHYEKHGEPAFLSVNTGEHYEPLLYILGLKEPGEPVQFFTEKIWGGSISMRSMRIG
ncbi:4,5-DOPA dioxygenase extradiol [Chloroflexota bacterium]